MEKSIIIVKSITFAMRGQQLLNNYGISAYLERNLGMTSRYGCGYSLRVKTEQAESAAELLRRAGIRVVDIIPLGGAFT